MRGEGGGEDRPQHDRIVSTYYYYLGFAYANEIPAVLPMLCMLAARDSAAARHGAARLLPRATSSIYYAS